VQETGYHETTVTRCGGRYMQFTFGSIMLYVAFRPDDLSWKYVVDEEGVHWAK